MNREKTLNRLRQESDPWDFIIIGGGATGLGTAVDAAARGYRTLLVERNDLAKGTSSRSTKLVHGGVRYLRQGNLSLVLGALRERGRLHANAPHLTHPLGFVIPLYRWTDKPFYGLGIKLYDRLAGKLGLGRSRVISPHETLKRLPTLRKRHLQGGVLYFDGQFDDARLAVNLAQTAADHGTAVLNYAEAVGILHEGGRASGVRIRDREGGEEFEVRGKCVINATGIFTDTVRRMDAPDAASMLVFSQGSHLVLPKRFQPGDDALMVPKTSDGRVLFAVPWHDRVVVGTTDVPVENAVPEPSPHEGEIRFLMDHAAAYFDAAPTSADVLSVYSGLRALVSRGGGGKTSSLSRDHAVVVSESGLVTITGGKWTTYRKMGEDTVDRAETVAGFEHRTCPTEHLRLHGAEPAASGAEELAVYGSDAAEIEKVAAEQPDWNDRLHPRLPIRKAEIVWAARREMARRVEDVLARRTRALILDARASAEAAPEAARLLAGELGRDEAWQRKQVKEYRELARHYLIEEG